MLCNCSRAHIGNEREKNRNNLIINFLRSFEWVMSCWWCLFVVHQTTCLLRQISPHYYIFTRHNRWMLAELGVVLLSVHLIQPACS